MRIGQNHGVEMAEFLPAFLGEFQFVIHPDKQLTVKQLEELRDAVNDFLAKNNLSGGGEWKS
jgi:hypothetical protein